MIFVIGAICTIVGFFMIRVLGCSPINHVLKRYNNWDYIGTVFFFLGIILMIISLGKLLWHYLP